MRIREIILEDFNLDKDDVYGVSDIEDAAETRGDAALLSVLEELRHEAAESDAVTPRVKMSTVVDRVRAISGNEQFNFANFEEAYKHNETVKNIIKGPPEDDKKTGEKYIYFSPPENEIDDSDPLGAQGAPAGDASKVVSAMAKRAASK